MAQLGHAQREISYWDSILYKMSMNRYTINRFNFLMTVYFNKT